MQFLGKNIRYLRKQFPVTQSQLASLIGKGQTTIGNWENGISEPSIEELLILSNYFDISLDVLIKVDLGKTNYQLEKRRKEGDSGHKPPVKYFPAEEVSVVSEQVDEGLSYVLQEIKALREEVARIGSLLPDVQASGVVAAPEGSRTGSQAGGKQE
ncbi:MAG TPA: helix-turn-helix domain-containing protein [Puia sp.]